MSYDVDVGEALMGVGPESERQKQQSGNREKQPHDPDPLNARQYSAD